LNVVKSYKDVNVKYFDTKGMILDILRKKKLFAQELANKLARSESTVLEHLRELERNEKIKKEIKHFNRWGVCKKSMYRKYFWRLI